MQIRRWVQRQGRRQPSLRGQRGSETHAHVQTHAYAHAHMQTQADAHVHTPAHTGKEEKMARSREGERYSKEEWPERQEEKQVTLSQTEKCFQQKGVK